MRLLRKLFERSYSFHNRTTNICLLAVPIFCAENQAFATNFCYNHFVPFICSTTRSGLTHAP
jgi:hypothetical protein